MRALDVMRTIRDLTGVTAIDKAVLWALALRANDQNEAWPKYDTIAADAGLQSSRGAMKAIARLEKKGLLSVERRSLDGRSLSNMYRLRVTMGLPGVNQEHPAVNKVHGEGEPRSPGGVNTVHTNCPMELPNGTEREALVLAHSPPAPQSKVTITKAPRRKTQVPASDAPAEELAGWLARWGIPSPERSGEVAKMLDHFRATGEGKADWGATWRNWQRRAPEFAARGVARVGAQPETEAERGARLRRERESEARDQAIQGYAATAGPMPEDARAKLTALVRNVGRPPAANGGGHG